jgi:hypothetical protein
MISVTTESCWEAEKCFNRSFPDTVRRLGGFALCRKPVGNEDDIVRRGLMWPDGLKSVIETRTFFRNDLL